MERLTFDGNFCDIAKCGEINGGSSCKDGYCSQRKVWERLKQYEDAEAEGRLVMLPCKVGDTVWITGEVRKLYQAIVRTFFIGSPSYGKSFNSDIQMIRTTECDIAFKEFGKTVFLTKEEAEQVLKTNE